MREIKFRGKRIDTGEWAHGLYVYEEGWHYIVVPEYLRDGCSDCGSPCAAWHLVDVETVGQYTGLKDNNGKEIFEGDIVRTELGYVQIIVWSDMYAAFVAEYPNLDRPYRVDCTDEIIGNIHENPELLEV